MAYRYRRKKTTINIKWKNMKPNYIKRMIIKLKHRFMCPHETIGILNGAIACKKCGCVWAIDKATENSDIPEYNLYKVKK